MAQPCLQGTVSFRHRHASTWSKSCRPFARDGNGRAMTSPFGLFVRSPSLQLKRKPGQLWEIHYTALRVWRRVFAPALVRPSA